MRVLHLTLSFAEGGRRQAISTLVRGLRGLGVACDLGCLEALGCDPQEPAALFDETLVLNRRRLLDPRALWRLRQFCRRRDIAIIRAHGAASQFTAALVQPALLGVPVLMTYHRSRSLDTTRPMDRLRNALGCAATAAVATVSQDRRQHYLAQKTVPARKVICIPNGIDTARFYPDPATRVEIRRELGVDDSTLLLGAVGHFGPEKGLDVVIRGFQLLARRDVGAPVRLLVLGDGTPEQRQLLTEIAGRGPGDVQFTGFRRDVDRWFRALDVFVHAPRLEAFGLVLAEAMATALPVVASRVGGIPEIVRDGVTGLLVPPDHPEALADALTYGLQDRALLGRLAQEGRRVALENFSARLFARRYLHLYQSLLAGRCPTEAAAEALAPGEEPAHA